MEFFIKQDEFMNYYTLPEDKLELGDVQLLAIQYQFFNQRFSGVFVFFKGETNHSKMKTICEGRFGEPTNTGFETIA